MSGEEVGLVLFGLISARLVTCGEIPSAPHTSCTAWCIQTRSSVEYGEKREARGKGSGHHYSVIHQPINESAGQPVYIQMGTHQGIHVPSSMQQTALPTRLNE